MTNHSNPSVVRKILIHYTGSLIFWTSKDTGIDEIICKIWLHTVYFFTFLIQSLWKSLLIWSGYYWLQFNSSGRLQEINKKWKELRIHLTIMKIALNLDVRNSASGRQKFDVTRTNTCKNRRKSVSMICSMTRISVLNLITNVSVLQKQLNVLYHLIYE